MTLDNLDRLLAEWKSAMDTTAQNLVELHNLPSYEILIGAAGSPRLKLAGATDAHLAPAILAIEQLLGAFGVLSDTIQQATELRQKIARFPGWGSEQKIREIARILTQASIPWPRNAAAPQQAITPSQLLTHMNEAFGIARNALVEVDETWKRLDAKLAAATSFLNTHGSEVSTALLRGKIDTLRTRVLADPLGAAADFDRDIQPVLARTRIAVEALVGQRANVRENLARGRELLRQLVELRQEAEESCAECKAKITAHAPPTPPLPWDRVTALADWLGRLEAKLADGLVDPVCVGLENWTGHVNELIALEERACAENRVPLELRRELRGRLSALKAKALARGTSSDPKLAEISERASSLLHARPTPLSEAVALVSQYESRLNGRA